MLTFLTVNANISSIFLSEARKITRAGFVFTNAGETEFIRVKLNRNFRDKNIVRSVPVLGNCAMINVFFFTYFLLSIELQPYFLLI